MDLKPQLELRLEQQSTNFDGLSNYITTIAKPNCDAAGGTLETFVCHIPPPPPPPAPEPILEPYIAPQIASSSYGNGYTQCAGYAKSRRPDIPNNWGNAGNWLYSAQAIGWPTGSNPIPGSVAWLKGGNHVAVVDSVNSDGSVTISEANYSGLAYNQRVTPASDWLYIY